MRAEIIEHIAQLEKEQGITILFAAESGSRAWGCPSPDSDYDVRIIFKRPKADYLLLDEKPDTINYFHGELLDINGWDIRKTLKLMRKSNVTPFEWLQSPIIYMEKEGFKSDMLDLCKKYFQARHSINHYKGIAKNSFLSNDAGDEIKLKKLFYVLRPLMAAKWIISKNELPPMDLPQLMQIIEDKAISNHITELLKIKSTVNEDYVHKIDKQILDYIESEFKIINENTFEEKKVVVDSDLLNIKFIEIIDS